VKHRYSALSTVGAIVASDSDSRATVRSKDFHQALLDADYDIEHTLIKGAPSLTRLRRPETIRRDRDANPRGRDAT
jgi:hypothetical protein